MLAVGRTLLLLVSVCVSVRSIPSCERVAPPSLLQESVVFAGVYAYAISSPDTLLDLATDLREISGLSAAGDSLLVAVQDEDGVAYGLDPSTGRIEWRSKFFGKGDFEAVELHEGRLWVVRSDGDIFVRPMADDGRARRIKTRLRSRDDIESLAWSPHAGKLLLAAKERLSHDRHRSVFAFDPYSETLEPDTWATISIDTVASALGVSRKKAKDFKPSALAVHPGSGNVFVLSSSLPALAVLSPEGNFVGARLIDRNLLQQPEGLAFSESGTLYIASEGDKRGRLAVFSQIDLPLQSKHEE